MKELKKKMAWRKAATRMTFYVRQIAGTAHCDLYVGGFCCMACSREKPLHKKKNGEKANLPLWLCFSNIFLSLIWDYLSWTCKWHLIYVHVYIQNLCSGLAFFLPRLYFIPLKTRKYSVLLKQISFSFDEDFRRIVSSQRYNEGNGVVRPVWVKEEKKEFAFLQLNEIQQGTHRCWVVVLVPFIFSLRKFQSVFYCGRVGY